MTIVNNPYITIIVGLCSIIGRNLPLYGVIRVVKRVVAVAQWLWWGEDVCGCDGGAVVVVEKGVWL